MGTPEQEHLWSLWQRNVVDRFKSMETEDIKKTLQSEAKPFAAMFMNWAGDFNIGTGIRNANGFNAKEVFYYGKKRFDRRGVQGVHNYTSLIHLSEIEQLVELKSKYRFVGIENTYGGSMINDYKWQPNSLMIFGEEGVGLSKEIIDLCDDVVEIPMFGSVRSFNCGVASGIAMYDFVTKIK